MAKTASSLGFFDYVKAAFNWKVKLKGLGFLPLNKLLVAGFAILGFGHPGFWFLGMAYEIAYLLFVSGSERFQRLVQGIQLQETQADMAKRQAELLAALDKPSQERYRRFTQACNDLLQITKSNPGAIGIEGIQAGDLNQLLGIFLRLLHSRQKIRRILSQTTREALEQEIQDLSAKLAKEPEASPAYRSLKGTLEIQNRRLENRNRAEESLKVAENELDRIEKQAVLITEETMVTSDPEVLSIRLDGVIQSLQGTTRWMSEQGEFFGFLETDPDPASSLTQAKE
ncbi:MAG: hypothetical protein K6U80_11770 [Firmicutes bacterium]|nr:hypothetical protein [Bacillota bacterium]